MDVADYSNLKYYICNYMNNFWYKIRKSMLQPFQRLPLGFHYALGNLFAWFAKDIFKYRRDVIVTNLSRSFPEKKYDEIQLLKDEAYKHIGELFAEAMWFGGCKGNPERLKRQRIIEMEKDGVDSLLKSFAERPSVMVMSSHYGNWELTSGIFTSLDFDENQLRVFEDSCYVVYKRLASPFWDRFIGENRQANLQDCFKGYVESDDVLRLAFRNKGRKSIYLFPTDQFPYGSAAARNIGSFMNQPTLTMIGGAALARKFGMSVFETFFVRTGKGKYKVVLEKICDDAGQFTPEEIMSKYYSILEKYVKEDPGNYLWSHKRWK